jgi:hypothetical protein
LGPFLTRQGDNMAFGIEARHAKHGNFRAPPARYGAKLFRRMTPFHCDQPALGRHQVPSVM